MPQPNPALKPQVYSDQRPASDFQHFHTWARSHGADAIQDLVRLVVVPWCMLVYRARASDAPSVPSSGPAIIAPNHFSALDHFFVAMYLRRRVRFMGKSQLFAGPLGWVLMHAGAFPVRRGHHDEEAIATALAILARGGVVVLYPEGGRSRTDQMGDRARPGVGRLALESGAPVVPAAIVGSHRARHWRRLQFPAVRVRYGSPRRYSLAPGERIASRERQQAVADEVLADVRRLWAGGGLAVDDRAGAQSPSHRGLRAPRVRAGVRARKPGSGTFLNFPIGRPRGRV
jgi:1-acyl-sn-glycerol-3-phosphate acyltransferase